MPSQISSAPGKTPGSRVVAVPVASGESVAVVVLGLVRRRVAVVVDAVALLGVAGEYVGVQIVAVAIANCDAVAVEVEALVDHAVAVVVDAVADLFGCGVDQRVVVIAVLAEALAVAVAI